MDIWIWSRPYLGLSGLNRSWYNEVRVINEFSKGFVHGIFLKISVGSFFWYFHINRSLWIYEFGHDHIWGSRDWIGADLMKFEFSTNSQRVSTREFHENFTGKFLLIFSHKWIPIDIRIWSWPHLGQSRINRSRYNEVRVFDEFSKGLVHGNFLKISSGKYFWYFHINEFLWIYEFSSTIFGAVGTKS